MIGLIRHWKKPRGNELIYCLTIGTFAKPENFFTMGVTAGLAYELPYKRSVPYRKPAEVYHRRSRRDLYHKLEIMLKTQGKDGRACVLGALCQAGKRNWASTADRRPFLDEILHSIFTFPAYTGGDAEDGDGEESHEEKLKSTEYDRAYGAQDDCDKYFASCPSLF
ncbi:PREDICTED: uncharacterized protein LOC105363167 isoform X2 [Ceratosolen solmsi marchali]|uniref:Uncharacterized protein LOC105363167 isoform X2 n=1 Tax=Ceratosolen solmsi marchali TaxID=326594 RepID=A0AAJ6YJC4_9HYME|nr:PREDICTED: uncharacterized protein LOC105363167 isoform X2 [Ceratosolen solmsi marchali]